eukprot:6822443-Prymnesium_polylepis.1
MQPLAGEAQQQGAEVRRHLRSACAGRRRWHPTVNVWRGDAERRPTLRSGVAWRRGAPHRLAERHRAWVRHLERVEGQLVVERVQRRQPKVVDHDLGLRVRGVWGQGQGGGFGADHRSGVATSGLRTRIGVCSPGRLARCASKDSVQRAARAANSTQALQVRTVTPSQNGFFDELTYWRCRLPASTSLQISVSATDDAGLKVYLPPSWHSLNSKIAVDWTTTSTTKAPSCRALHGGPRVSHASAHPVYSARHHLLR